jgi:SAM-dependent methyltransferase
VTLFLESPPHDAPDTYRSMTRHAISTPELDAAEQQWWAENADLEEEYCWVFTPQIQRFLRGPYLKGITGLVAPGGSVLDVGCGTGWLTLLLAQGGASNIVGTDFSAAQIERARQNARESGLGSKVRFVQGGVDADPARPTGGYDLVVMHAFLHHLSTAEIRQLLHEVSAVLAENGRVAIVEPILEASGPERTAPLRVLRRMAGLAMFLNRRGVRRVSAEERVLRDRLESRCAVELPFGPAPKETPFDPKELEGLLDEVFTIEAQRPCISMTHLVAQDLLLAQLSQPRLWRLMFWPELAMARVLDARMLTKRPYPSTVWVFALYICKKRAIPHPERLPS